MFFHFCEVVRVVKIIEKVERCHQVLEGEGNGELLLMAKRASVG